MTTIVSEGEPKGLARLVETLRERIQDSLFDKKQFIVTTQRTSEGYKHQVRYDCVVNDIPIYMGEVKIMQKMNEDVLDIIPEKNNIESTATKYKFRPLKLFQ